jgi:hypothetical protein
MGTARPNAWPQRSPDLRPLYCYLWGHLRTLLYASPVDNKMAPPHRLVDACRIIRNCPDISERMRSPKMRHVEGCTEFRVRYYEHLLWMYVFSCNKLNVSGQMFTWTFFLVLVRETRAQSLSPSFSYSLCSAVTHFPVQILISSGQLRTNFVTELCDALFTWMEPSPCGSGPVCRSVEAFGLY